MNAEYESACEDLQKALQYDKTNIEARNILGLIHYRRGEIGECVRQWTLSVHCQPEGNRAQDYLDALQKNRRQDDLFCDSIILYNEAIDQAQKGDMEFAIIRLRKAIGLNHNFIRAYLLLALCYIQIGSLKKAASALDRAEEMEPRRSEAVHLRGILEQKTAAGETDAMQEIRDYSRNFYMQAGTADNRDGAVEKGRRSFSFKGGSGLPMQMLMFFCGALCCLGVLMLLYVPAKITRYKEENLLMKNELAQAGDLTAELETARKERDEALLQKEKQQEENRKTLDELRRHYEDEKAASQDTLLLQAANQFYAKEYVAAGDLLYSVDKEKLTESGKTFYQALMKELQPYVVAEYSSQAYNRYAAALALKGEARTQALEAVLPDVQKAYEFAQGTNWEAWQLYYQASIYQLLGQRETARAKIDQFFQVYRGSTGADIYTWASELRASLTTVG